MSYLLAPAHTCVGASINACVMTFSPFHTNVLEVGDIKLTMVITEYHYECNDLEALKKWAQEEFYRTDIEEGARLEIADLIQWIIPSIEKQQQNK